MGNFLAKGWQPTAGWLRRRQRGSPSLAERRVQVRSTARFRPEVDNLSVLKLADALTNFCP